MISKGIQRPLLTPAINGINHFPKTPYSFDFFRRKGRRGGNVVQEEKGLMTPNTMIGETLKGDRIPL